MEYNQINEEKLEKYIIKIYFVCLIMMRLPTCQPILSTCLKYRPKPTANYPKNKISTIMLRYK